MVTIKRVFLVLCVLLVLAGPVDAVSFSTYGATQYTWFFEDDAGTMPESMVFDYNHNRIIYADNTNSEIRGFYAQFPTDQSSTSLMIQNVPGISCVGLLSNGDLVLGFSDQKVYLVDDFNGLIDFSDPTDKAEYFSLLTTLTASAEAIIVDGNNNIYVSDINEKITKISQPYYMVAQLQNLPPIHYNTNGASLDTTPDGLLITYGSADAVGHAEAAFYNPDTQTAETYFYRASAIYNNAAESSKGRYLANGDVVMIEPRLISAVHNQYVTYLNNTNSYSKTDLFRVAISTSDNKHFNDVVVSPDGLIYLAIDTGGFIAVDSGGVVTSYPFSYDGNQGGEVEEPGINTLEWELAEYTTGDTASLNVSISNQKWDTANYTYYLNIYDHASLKNTQTFTEQNSTKTYTFEPAQIASSFLAQAKRQHTNGTVETLASGLTSFVETGASYAVTFDKEVYSTSDTMTMLYSDVPANTTLFLQGWDDDIQSNVYENTWTVSGSGSESLTVPNPNAESYTVRILYDGYVLDSDYSEITAATESHLYGVVYNAATGARIENAEVSIDDTYKLTDEIGAYSWVVETGEHDLSCALDGFQTISYDDYMISGNKEVNFYLSPNAVGDSVYVMVKDYETKAPIQNAHVIVYNDTWSIGDYSSNTGLVELAAPDGAYSLKVIKDGYDNIEKSIDTSTSSFFDVLMASGSYNPNAPGAGGLAEDESLTDYYNARFREFAPTAWGFFLLVIVLYLLSILTSFGGSKSRR